MTIAIGLRCVNGIVLCTDSLESDGMTKRNVEKTWCPYVSKRWGIAIASAGEADLADSFTDGLGNLMPTAYDENKILQVLRKAITETRNAYPDAQLALLIGLYYQTSDRTRARIFRIMDRSVHLGPVRSYQSIGIGAHLSDFLLSQIYSPHLFVEEAQRLGILCIARAKEHVDGCGGPTQIASWTIGETFWREMTDQKISEIESEFEPDGFRKALSEYWKEHNPPSRWETLLATGHDPAFGEPPKGSAKRRLLMP